MTSLRKKRSGYLAVALVAVVALATPLLLAQQASAAPEVNVRDNTAETTRTIPAYKDSDDDDRRIRVFGISFDAQEGQRFYITSKVIAEQASSTPDELLMAAASIQCYPSGDSHSSAGATENVLRGKTTTLTPRFVYTAPEDGQINCYLTATGLRPRPAEGNTTDNVWTVATGSWLAASVEVPEWARTMKTSAKSRVLNEKEQWTPNKHTISVGEDVSAFELISDHKVTTCSAVGGSSDSTTDGKNLCEGRVSKEGTDVVVEVFARQRTADGEWCGDATKVAETSSHVDKDVHHKMMFAKGVVEVNPDCDNPRFELYGTVKAEKGADLMIHAPSEVMAVIPQ